MAERHRKSPVRLDIIVVGAGLSGLATAIATTLSGHKVTVFESAKEPHEIGAGLQVTPNATRILQQWDLPESLWRSAAEPASVTVHRYSGEVLAREEGFDRTMRARYGAPFLDLHRVDLHAALYARARALGVGFRLGETVAAVNFDSDDDNKPEVIVVCDGARASATADLVVAADGLWSRCRACLLGRRADPPRPTGDLAYRVVLDAADLEEHEDAELREWVARPACRFWIGPGAHAAGYSVRAGSAYNLVLLVPDDLPDGVSKLDGDIGEMRARFEGWDPRLTRLLGLVRGVRKWKLMHRDELDSWINEQSNMVMVGDSCHPMLPYLAQGANSAIEDGAVLGHLLGHIKAKSQLPKALKMYETLRKARGEAIVRETFKQRESFHMPDGPEQEARDRIFRLQLETGEVQAPFPSRWTCPQVQPWLYGYDAYKEVEEAVLQSPFPDVDEAVVANGK
ncbi:FAD binding domain-containing protein [Biscogniauxia mediterranea]|nr:FAD binding domain-containing protein [Biscogniauxia mediterranea]